MRYTANAFAAIELTHLFWKLNVVKKRKNETDAPITKGEL
jgi:hypothetical protein